MSDAHDRVLVDQVLKGLPRRDRALLRLRFHADLSQREIAELVCVSQTHVSRNLREALETLRARSTYGPCRPSEHAARHERLFPR